ncbi:MAG: hypothetical protein WCE38_18790, partial [Burkholderiales bacterium]
NQTAHVAQKLAPNIKVLFTTTREATLHDKWSQEKVRWLLKPYSHQELARELKALLAPVAGVSPTGRLPASPRT